MKKLTWVAWILLAWPAHAQLYTSMESCLRNHNTCQSAAPTGPWWPSGGVAYDVGDTCRPGCGINPNGDTTLIQQDKVGAVYSTPAPARNWNLLTKDGAGLAIVPHLYEAECSKILLEVINHGALTAPYKAECFQTPES